VPPPRARYFLDPFGCVKNQVDAETMMAFLGASGWSVADNPDDAELIIVNSCGFIEKAKQESINAVLSWRRRYPGKKILLAGCLAQRYAAELARSLPEADGLFGNGDLAGIVAAAAALMPDSPGGGAAGSAGAGPPSLRPPRPKGLRCPPLPPPAGLPGRDSAAPVSGPAPGGRPLLSLPGSAYVKISEGCDNRCSFCSIPLIRGPLRSRAIPGVVDECRALLDRGIRELCVIGQDIASFGKDRGRAGELPALLEAIAALPGHFWVRLLYLHPDHIPLPILDIMAGDRRFLPYFDIPLQHASGPLLRAMNRRGDGARYLDLIRRIRGALPGAVIRSTFLVGFPGETGEDFARLLEFQEQAGLDWAGCFTYSREEDTPAYAMKNQVPRRLAAERKRILETRQQGISEGRMERFVGGDYEVLVEERFESPDRDPADSPPDTAALYLGRLYCQAPEVDGVSLIFSEEPLGPGSLVRGRVQGRAGFDLEVRALRG
jgi:ribosomal protein S12 methylthiotransferase